MNNIVKKGGVGAAVVALYVGLVSAVAGASPPTTEDAIEDGFEGLQGLFTGTIAVALLALVIAIVGVTLGVRWLRRASSGG